MADVYAAGGDRLKCLAAEPVYPVEGTALGIGPMLNSDRLDWAFVHAVTHTAIQLPPQEMYSVIPFVQSLCKEVGRPFLPTPFTMDVPPPPGLAFVTHSTPIVDLTVPYYLCSLTAKRRYKLCKAVAAYPNAVVKHLRVLPEYLIDWCMSNAVQRWRDDSDWDVATAMAQPLLAHHAEKHGFEVDWIVVSDYTSSRVLAVLSFLTRTYNDKKFALFHSFTCNAGLHSIGALKDIGLASLGLAVNLLKEAGYDGINVTGFTDWDNPPFNVYKYAVCNDVMPVYTVAVLDKPAPFHPPFYLDGEHT